MAEFRIAAARVYVVGLSAGGAMAASHPGVVAKTTHVTPIQSPGKTLYSQNSNFLSQSLVSDNFTSGTFGSYSDAGADDFVVPAGKKWKVTGVDVTGLYSNCTAGVNCGPATSEVITFYTPSVPLRPRSACAPSSSAGPVRATGGDGPS